MKEQRSVRNIKKRFWTCKTYNITPLTSSQNKESSEMTLTNSNDNNDEKNH